ncbi:MAG: MFS family permease [Francisellaceae bacterium]|jgi:MFS family permease
MGNNQKISLIGITIWLICAVFFMYEFLLRTILGTFEHPIMYDLNLSLVTFAILSSTAYQLIYGVMQVPVGIITDRFGLKKSLFLAVVICALAVIGFGSTHTFDTAVIFRLLMGFGSSFGFLCLLIAVYEWMPRKNIALFIGLSQLIGTMGPMLAAGPLNSLSSRPGIEWRYIFHSLGLIGFIIGVLVLLFVKNNRASSNTFQILKKPELIMGNIYRLVRQPQVWLIAVFSASVYFTIEYLSENSGKRFLMLNGYSSDVSSYMLTISWLGYAIGCPLLGFISDLTNKRKSMMVLSSIFCIISALLIIYAPINIAIIVIAFFMLGLGASGQSIGFAIMAEQCSSSFLAVGLGLNNAMIMLVVALNGPLISWVLSMISGNNLPTIENYQFAFIIILLFMFLAFIISAFFIKETFCKSTKETIKLLV